MALSKRRRVLNQPIDTLDRFPAEIWTMILNQCDLLTVFTMQEVSRPLYNLIKDPTGHPATRIKRILNEYGCKLWESERCDDDTELNKFAQIFGLSLYPWEQSDGCELTLNVRYHFHFQDFIERPRLVQRFRQFCKTFRRPLCVVGPVIADFKRYRPDLDVTQFDADRYCDHLSPAAIRHLEKHFKINWEQEMQVCYNGLDAIESRRQNPRSYLRIYIEDMLNQSMKTVAGGKYNFTRNYDQEFTVVNGRHCLRRCIVYRLAVGSWIVTVGDVNTVELMEIATCLVEVGLKIERTLSQ